MTDLEKLVKWAHTNGYVDAEVKLDLGKDCLFIRLLREKDLLEIKISIRSPDILNIKRWNVFNMFKTEPKAPVKKKRRPINNFLPLLELDICLEGKEIQ